MSWIASFDTVPEVHQRNHVLKKIFDYSLVTRQTKI